jgi:hypothetical protein
MNNNETDSNCHFYNWGGDIEKGFTIYPTAYGARCEKNGEFFRSDKDGKLKPNCYECKLELFGSVK